MRPVPPGSDPDRWPPALAHLLVGDVSAALEACVGPRAGPIVAWRPHQVTHRVGRSTVVQYRVRSESPSGRSTTATVVLTHGLGAGAATMSSAGHRLGGWRLPDDPSLPGLARSLDPAKVAALLQLIGRPVGPITLRRRAYRPGRRAVVEVTGTTGRAFLKVVRPGRAAALVDAHRRSGRTLPVPTVLGCTADGIVVLSALPGRTLRAALTAVDPAEAHLVDRLPDLAAIEAHLDRLPVARPVSGIVPRARDPLATLHRHVALLGTVLPDHRPALEALVDGVAGRLRSDHPVVAVHGDLYESQIMVSRGNSPQICGILDLDTVGPGHRVDDLATLCAHLSTLSMRTAPPTGSPAPLGDPTTPVGRYLAGVVRGAEAAHDPVDLRARIAGRVVGLATGPFRVQEDDWPEATVRRIALAEAWSASATP